MKRSKAFTLIELLVVVAIISLLVSILIPSLQKAKDLAKGVACASNLRQIGIAVAFYADQYDETLPNSDGSGYWYNWAFKLVQAGLVETAIGGSYRGCWTGSTPSSAFVGIQAAKPGEVQTIFHCPSFTYDDLEGTGVTYYTNAYGTPQGVMGIPSTGPAYSKLDMFSCPSETVAAYDSTNFQFASNNRDVGAIWGAVFVEEPLENINIFFSNRHSDGSNCLYLDGHVEHNMLDDIRYQVKCPPRSYLPY